MRQPDDWTESEAAYLKVAKENDELREALNDLLGEAESMCVSYEQDTQGSSARTLTQMYEEKSMPVAFNNAIDLLCRFNAQS